MTATFKALFAGTVLGTLALGIPGCGWWDSVTGPSDIRVPTSSGMTRLVDGAGREGPGQVRWIEVWLSPARNLISFRAEICMDAVPNPTNNVYLAEMRFVFDGSADGIDPVVAARYHSEGDCRSLWRMERAAL